ncbi:hypothetical protein [Acinetobacter stercoris]|uniref:DUF4402 domain-containing protein n=1 Tax=Acinetobacter stercoris TaxID=2126983 RepID=A0A2U3MX09_9GAMM|nr:MULTISPECIES: hypothetical protein [Acinetobacter]SPL69972.1 hypothetical protein KPC_1150 [Acinetobacter stercoris]
MSKIVKTVLASLVFGLCSAAAFADGEDLAAKGGGGGHGGHNPGNSGCGTTCNGKIDISLDVPKHCDLDIITDTITLANTSGNSWSGSGSFTVAANSDYRLNITAPTQLNNGLYSVGVNVDTKKPGGASYMTGEVLPFSASARTFTVQANSTFDPTTTRYGTYTGIYQVAVDF